MTGDLARRLRGRVLSPAPPAWHRDFGRTRCRAPVAVVRPADAADVAETLRYAARAGLRVAARGHGCSSDGQSLSDGLVLDTSALAGCALGADGTATLGAGIGWGAAHRRLAAAGAALPVVPSSEHATPGGTLSVGGYGPTSPFAGSLADAVESLDLVLGTGEVLRATPDGPYAEIFRYALCGLGRIAVIVAARLRLGRHRPHLLLRHVTDDDPAAAGPGGARSDRAGSGAAAGDDEVVRAALRGDAGAARAVLADGRWVLWRLARSTATGRWRTELGRPADVGPPGAGPGDPAGAGPAALGEEVVGDYPARLFAAEAVFSDRIAAAQVAAGRLADPAAARRVWGDFFVPIDRAPAFLAALAELFPEPVHTPVWNSAILPAAVMRHRLPLSPMPHSALVRTVGVYSVVPPDRVNDYRDRFDRATALCHAAGGRQYLHGYHRGDADFLRAQFGAATIARWRAVKARCDPGGVLGPPPPL
ncbi:hypothetical protein GCM10010123_40580 [Pilimelia anulata]|uniref:FAD-binding PCMH-type domain-containing protein n=1 Tax=Pilimelia anulata TaxID=53371 RepID=A0A8J3FCN2_9ACTN|nr:FAD-binding oxidoreductase [Pilimelia anulata]GGK06682.1 hypothetical protein GCM10010123_40580 [Pilimelia anulata]